MASNLTLQVVKKAVDELKQENKRITYRNVREKVGYGSFTTLRPLIENVLAADFDIPPDTEAMYKPLLNAAIDITKDVVSGAVANCKGTIDRLMADLDEATMTIKILECEKTDLMDKLSHQEKDLAQMAALAETRDKDANEARTLLRNAEKDASNFQGQNEQLREHNDQLLQQNQKLSKQIETFAAKIDFPGVDLRKEAKGHPKKS
jgi:hypothetical protein